MIHSLRRILLKPALPIVVALLMSGAISFSYNRLLKAYRDAVDHTFHVLAAIDTTLLKLQDAETGQRGYVITGDETYLAPFRNSRDGIPLALEKLDTLVSDNAAQRAQVAVLRRLSTTKIDELEGTIATRRDLGFGAAQAQVIANDGKQAMDGIRDAADAMRSAEHALFEKRTSEARFAERAMIGVALLCVTLSLLGRYVAARLGKRD